MIRVGKYEIIGNVDDRNKAAGRKTRPLYFDPVRCIANDCQYVAKERGVKMGQVIKKLQKFPFFDEPVEIELNDTIYGNEKIVHFHYKGIRYEMSLSDYLTILSGVIVSEKSLEELKK